MNPKNFTKKQSDVDLHFNAEIVDISKDVSGTKRLKSNSEINKIKDENSVLFTIAVDGSQHSEIALDVTTQEFFSENSKMLVIHVYNDRMNYLYNYKNKKEYVIDYYTNKIARFENRVNFVIEDKKETSIHSLDQVNNTSAHFKSNYMICGFNGMKGPRGDNNELSKGVTYLLGNSQSPTIIFKDTSLRSSKPGKGYNWLILLDKQYQNALRGFQAFLPLINPKKDFVYGLSLIESNSFSSNDDFKEGFMKEIEGKGIKNFEYDCTTYSRYYSQYICDKINYGEVQYDFVVFYNSREKHQVEASNSDISNLVKNSTCSICFYNF